MNEVKTETVRQRMHAASGRIARVKAWDRVARGVITMGGFGVVVSVLFIFLFIFVILFFFFFFVLLVILVILLTNPHFNLGRRFCCDKCEDHRLQFTLLDRAGRTDQQVNQKSDNRKYRHNHNTGKLVPERPCAQQNVAQCKKQQKENQCCQKNQSTLSQAQSRILHDIRGKRSQGKRKRRHTEIMEMSQMRMSAPVHGNVHDGSQERQYGNELTEA